MFGPRQARNGRQDVRRRCRRGLLTTCATTASEVDGNEVSVSLRMMFAAGISDLFIAIAPADSIRVSRGCSGLNADSADAHPRGWRHQSIGERQRGHNAGRRCLCSGAHHLMTTSRGQPLQEKFFLLLWRRQRTALRAADNPTRMPVSMSMGPNYIDLYLTASHQSGGVPH